MLTKKDLFSYDSYPPLDDVSLELYREFSEDVLLERTFEYTFDDSSTLNVQFTEFGIYHMLGIQHINGRIPNETFFNEIRTGLSFDSLSATNALSRRFKVQKPRIRMFSCVYQTLRLGEVFYLPSGEVQNTKSVVMDYVIHRKISEKGINIGIRQNKEDGMYIPLTILVSKAINPEKYIDRNNIKVVRSLTIRGKSGNILETIVHSDSFITSFG